MKTLKLILSITLLSFLTVEIYCQTEKGKILVGGNTDLNLTMIKSGGTRSTSFEFSPELGVFAYNGFAIGLLSQIKITSQNSGSGDKFNYTSLVFAPFVKNYFGTNHIKPYLQGAIGLGNSKNKQHYQISLTEYGESKFSLIIILYEVDGGIGIFLNDKLSLDVQLGYSHTSSKPKGIQSNTNKVTSGGFGVGAGFIIIL